MNAIYKFVMAQLAKGGGKTGLSTIKKARSLEVELSVKQIEQTLKNMGVDVSKLTSPKEVQKYLDIQASWLKQTTKPKKPSGEVVDLTGKKIDTSKPILGGKNVPESEAQIKSRLEGMNKKTVDRIRRKRYEAALKAEREKMAKDSEYIPEILDPDDFAGGGIAGMLGERTGFANGRWLDPGKSPGTSGDYTPGQGHREDRKPYPYTPHFKDWPPSLRTSDLREEARKKREEAKFEAMWRGAPPGMGEREKMFRVQREAKRLVDEKQEAFEKKIKEREKLYPYADMTEAEFAELHPKIYDYMKKDPAWDWETFQTVSFANPGETFQTTGASDYEGRGLPLGKTNTETLDLYMTPFGVTNYEMRAGPVVPDKSIMSDFKKAGVVLHELRHKKILKNPLLVEAQPPGAVDEAKRMEMMKHGMGSREKWGKDYGPYTPTPEKEVPIYRHRRPPGSKEEFSHPLDMHEVFNRFLDTQYGSWKTSSGPYFDKIWRDEWQPYADKYEKILKEYDLSPVNLADGGIAGMLGEPTYADGGRTGFKGKKFDPTKRTFLKVAAGLASIPLIGKYFKWAKPLAKSSKVLTQVPIGNAPGMPPWFKLAVNKVIKEGDDVTKKFATKDREIVHRAQIDKNTTVDVIQDLETGNVRLEYDAAGNMGYGPIQLDYKAGEVIESTISKTGQVTKGTKTKPEFSAVESEPRVTNWDGDIEFDGENIVSKVDDLLTDTTKLETYATGKNPTIKKLLKSEQKQKKVNKLNDDTMEQIEYIENKQGHMGPEDLMEAEDAAYHASKEGLASGGRVPLAGGGGKKLLDLGIAALRKKFGKDIIKKGSELKKPQSVLEREMFERFNKKIAAQEQKPTIDFSNPRFKAALEKAGQKGKALSDAAKKMGFDTSSARSSLAFDDAIEAGMEGFPAEIREQIIRAKYGGVVDTKLLNQMIADTDPHHLSTVMGTVEEGLKMQEMGMGADEILDVIKESVKRKPSASGGLAGVLGE